MSVDEMTDLLRAHALRVTPQRQAILQAFRGTSAEHLSAEEVAARASRRVSNIGRGTVYATLAELAEVGLLSSVGSSDPIRYETNLTPHDHFRCRLCLRLFDVDLGLGLGLDAPSLEPDRLPGFSIESVAAHVEGVCAECGDYERGLREGAATALTVETLPERDLDALVCTRIDSPVGDLALVASSEGIVRVAYSDHADFPGLLARARSRRGATAARVLLTRLSGAIDDYFAGGRAPLTDVIDWRLLNDEQHAALDAVRRIPFAEPCSYECLDSTLDPYARGRLMGVNPLPLLVPCHRISRGAEYPEVYVGGAERARFLRTLERA